MKKTLYVRATRECREPKHRVSLWLRVHFACGFCFLLMGLLLGACAPDTVTLEPKLLSVEPASGVQGKATKITIVGQDFPEKPLLVLFDDAGSEYPLEGVVRLDAQRVEAMVPANVPATRLHLKLKLDAESKELWGAFSIQAKVLAIYTIQVAQGDSTLIVSPSGRTMLIDAGREEEAGKVLSFLQQKKIKKLDYVMATHYDADHVGALEKVVNGPDGKPNTDDDLRPQIALLDPAGKSKNYSYARLQNRLTRFHRGLDGQSADSFPSIDLGGGVSVKVHVTNGVILKSDGSRMQIDCKKDANCRSIGVMVSLGTFRYWTAGDLTGGGNGTPDVETPLATEIGRADVYRAHHHGSKTSSSTRFLQTLQPQVVLLSAGEDNSYCHPHPDVLQRLMVLPDVWLFSTTAGIINKSRCGEPTAQQLSSLAQRAQLKANNIELTSDGASFSILLPNEQRIQRWTALAGK